MKRILSLDGGGIRGVISLAFLERIEDRLKRQKGDPDFRLCQHYDMIGGTSTGALIATGLATGRSVSELVESYLYLSAEAFGQPRWMGQILVPKFRTGRLREAIRHHVGDITLGSDAVKTGLGVVAKRLDTNSPWIFHNCPDGPFFATGSHPNRDIPLATILRASTAAPSYFRPEVIEVGEGESGVFLDGGVSPYNNPSQLLFRLATLKAHGWAWPTGADALDVTSIGAGRDRVRSTGVKMATQAPLRTAIGALRGILDDCTNEVQLQMQWMGRCETPWYIDAEIGDAADESLTPEPLFTYRRYDLELDRDWLAAEHDLRLSLRDLTRLSQFDNPGNARELLDLARVVAVSALPEG